MMELSNMKKYLMRLSPPREWVIVALIMLVFAVFCWLSGHNS